MGSAAQQRKLPRIRRNEKKGNKEKGTKKKGAKQTKYKVAETERAAQQMVIPGIGGKKRISFGLACCTQCHLFTSQVEGVALLNPIKIYSLNPTTKTWTTTSKIKTTKPTNNKKDVKSSY